MATDEKMSAAELAELKRLADLAHKIAPAPWEEDAINERDGGQSYRHSSVIATIPHRQANPGVLFDTLNADFTLSPDDRFDILNFAAASANAMPRLLAHIEALTSRALKAEGEAKTAQARLTARAKSMLRLRDKLTGIVGDIEDEGGRVYFGATGDADLLKDMAEDFDGWAWDDIMDDGSKPDFIGDNANLRKENADLKREADRMRDEIERLKQDNAFVHQRRGELVIERDNAQKLLMEYAEGEGPNQDLMLAASNAAMNAAIAKAEADRMRGALADALPSLQQAMSIIRTHVPKDALGTNAQGDPDVPGGYQSWPLLDEYLHYMSEAVAKAIAALSPTQQADDAGAVTGSETAADVETAFTLYRRAQKFLALPSDEAIDPRDYTDETELLVAELACALPRTDPVQQGGK